MKNENFLWIDSLRVWALFNVILIHVSAEIVYKYEEISPFNWWVANIYDSSARFCVPIFLMISGTLIFSKTYKTIGEFIKKRFSKILLPFLFWSTIYIAVKLFTEITKGERLYWNETLSFVFLKIKNGASYHFWYIYMIIGLYLFFPIIGKWLQNSDENEIKYFLGIWLLTTFMYLPFWEDFMPNIDFSYFSGYIGFPILGYYLNKLNSDFSKQRVLIILSVLAGAIMTIFGTYLMTYYQGSFYDKLYRYTSPNIILTSVGVFLFFKFFLQSSSENILFFSKYSYGAYLVHVLVLNMFKKLGISYDFINPIFGIPVISFLCLVVSTSIVWTVNKLPLGKHVSG